MRMGSIGQGGVSLRLPLPAPVAGGDPQKAAAGAARPGSGEARPPMRLGQGLFKSGLFGSFNSKAGPDRSTQPQQQQQQQRQAAGTPDTGQLADSANTLDLLTTTRQSLVFSIPAPLLDEVGGAKSPIPLPANAQSVLACCAAAHCLMARIDGCMGAPVEAPVAVRRCFTSCTRMGRLCARMHTRTRSRTCACTCKIGTGRHYLPCLL